MGQSSIRSMDKTTAATYLTGSVVHIIGSVRVYTGIRYRPIQHEVRQVVLWYPVHNRFALQVVYINLLTYNLLSFRPPAAPVHISRRHC